MNDNDWPTGRFEGDRPHLRAVACRMLGSLSEADDAAQESWLRLQRTGTDGIGLVPPVQQPAHGQGTVSEQDVRRFAATPSTGGFCDGAT